MSDRSRISNTIWMAAGAVLLLLYPLSTGPVVLILHLWHTRVGPTPDWVDRGIEGFYFPIVLALEHGPPWLRQLIESYLQLWAY